MACAEMASFGDIGLGITEHESLLSGMAAMIALAPPALPASVRPRRGKLSPHRDRP
jgi:hypothetical protein